MTTMLKARAVCVQTLAPLAQRAVVLGDASVAAAIATVLLDVIAAEEPALAAPTYLKKAGAKELSGMAMISLVSDERSEPLICAPNDLTGWTDSRFNTAMYAAAVDRLERLVAAKQATAVQQAVSDVLKAKLAAAEAGEVKVADALAERLNEGALIATDEAYMGQPLYLPPFGEAA
jgi:hypothetical protein